jgi:hypothetical protein
MKKYVAMAAFLLVSSGVAACSGENGGTPQPTPGTGASDSATAPVDPKVPKVSVPLDVSAFEGDPCKTVPEALTTELGYADAGVPRTGPEDVEKAGPACSWTIKGKGKSVQVILGTGTRAKGSGGLAGIYQAKTAGKMPFVEPAPEIEGYPVVHAGLSDRRANGSCGLTVGIADDLTFAAVASGYEGEQDSCGTAQQFAAAVIKTLKGA